MSINREDMMELTRRMTLSRNCFSRLAGAYMDEEGFIDGTFHTHFLKLSKAEQEKNLKLAKAIPFAKTNEQLKSHSIGSSSEFRKLLLALRECELKNDALLYNLYEYIGERQHTLSRVKNREAGSKKKTKMILTPPKYPNSLRTIPLNKEL